MPGCQGLSVSINDVTFGGEGVSQKVTKSDGGKGVSLFSKPNVTSLTVGLFFGVDGGEPKSDQK